MMERSSAIPFALLFLQRTDPGLYPNVSILASGMVESMMFMRMAGGLHWRTDQYSHRNGDVCGNKNPCCCITKGLFISLLFRCLLVTKIGTLFVDIHLHEKKHFCSDSTCI